MGVTFERRPVMASERLPDWSEGDVRVLHGDALARLRELPDACVDSLVTDPPAGISFMGASWDTFPTRQRSADHAFADGRSRPGIAADQEFNPRAKHAFIAWLGEVMAEALRVAKPGALGLVWAIPRTAHWTAWALEEAGWEIHPNGFVGHLFGSGFPKAKTHLKPGVEVWWLVRKPGRGSGLSIDGCRIAGVKRPGAFSKAPKGGTVYAQDSYTQSDGYAGDGIDPNPSGRWPANLVLSHAEGCQTAGTRRLESNWREHKGIGLGYHGSDSQANVARGHRDADGGETVEVWECVEGCPVAELDRQSGIRASGARAAGVRKGLGYHGANGDGGPAIEGSTGGASRFFYQAKASPSERSAGLPPGERNQHPTVKPLELMRWLCRLVTPPGGVVLDPFAGSGTTGCAAVLEGFGFVGIEQDEESARTAVARIAYWGRRGHQPALDLLDAPPPAAGPTCTRCNRPEAEVPGGARYPNGYVCQDCQAALLELPEAAR